MTPVRIRILLMALCLVALALPAVIVVSRSLTALDDGAGRA